MKIVFLAATLLVSAFASAADLGCDFSVDGKTERVAITPTKDIQTFSKTMGDFRFALDVDSERIVAITIKDAVRNVTTHTIATTGAGIFAKPRQLALESGSRYAEVNCW